FASQATITIGRDQEHLGLERQCRRLSGVGPQRQIDVICGAISRMSLSRPSGRLCCALPHRTDGTIAATGFELPHRTARAAAEEGTPVAAAETGHLPAA